MRSWRVAIGFLTVFPVRSPALDPGGLGRAAVWFPTVGLGIGLLLALIDAALRPLFPPSITAAVIVACWAAVTGGLHLDGLADCCDALFAAAPRERRLELMRDPRLGAFGGIGLVVFLMLKMTAIAAIAGKATALWAPSLAFMTAGAAGRWMILPVARQPEARPGGLGAAFAHGLHGRIFVIALLPVWLLCLLGGWRAVAAVGLAGLSTAGVIRFARSRLGGMTGDVLGLTVELAELTVLLAFVAG